MKYLFTFIFILVASLGIAQAPQEHDKQWYIQDHKGTEKAIWNFQNLLFDDPIVNFVEVKHPPSEDYGNDIFLIYDIDDYYCSRDQGLLQGQPGNVGYTIEQATNIKYLYFTNKYENDDPITDVSINSDASQVSTVIDIPSNPSRPILFANQDVVPNTDITLIIDREALFDKYRSSKNDLPSCRNGQYKLCLNEYLTPTGSIGPPLDLFIPSGIFKDQYQNDKPAYTHLLQGHDLILIPGTNCYEFSYGGPNPSKYLFFNLRATESASSLDPDLGQHLAIFKILCNDANNQVLEIRREAIRSSHDPNYIKITSVKDSAGHQIACYHVEFQNISTTLEALDLSLTMDFPSCVEVNSSSLNLSNQQAWMTSTTQSSSELDSITYHGQEITFHYANNDQLCKAEEISSEIIEFPPCTIGNIDFCINVKDNCNIWDCNLEPVNPYTQWGDDIYYIHEFIDPRNRTENSFGLPDIDEVPSESENQTIIHHHTHYHNTNSCCNSQLCCKKRSFWLWFILIVLGLILIFWIYSNKSNTPSS